MDKPSNLLQKSVNYKLKLYNIGPGACIIKLNMAVIYSLHNKLDCLSLNTRPGWKGFPGTKNLTYYKNP